MIKRFTAWILAFSIVCICASPSLADDAAKSAESDFAEEIAVLSALGIYETDIDEDLGFDPDDTVKTEDFLGAVLKMRLPQLAEGADILYLAQQYGIIDSAAAVTPGEKITFNDALKIAVTALDYKMLAQSKGGYPLGYLQAAKEIDLTDGVKIQGGERLTLGNMLKLLANAIDAPVAQIDVYGQNEYSFKNTDGITVLSEYRDIYKICGRVNENSYTGLSAVSSLADGDVRIDNTVYKSGSTAAADFLGMNVRAYVRGGKNVSKAEIIYISGYSCKNREITLDADDITYINGSCTELKYQRDGEKERSAALSAVRRVIYNGVIYDDFTKDDIAADNADVRLLDNDDDGKYDIVFVDCFDTTMFVNYVSGYDRLIYNRYSNSRTVSFEELYEDDGDAENVILADGERIKLTDIKKNDIVSIAKSKNPQKKLARVTVSRQTVTGVLKSYSESKLEATVTADGKSEKYKLNRVLLDEVNDESSKFDSLVLNREYIFYLDARGRIAAAVSEADAEWQYILILGMRKDSGIGDGVDVKYMDEDGEWHIAPLAKKVEYQNAPGSAAAVYKALAGDGRVTPQIAYARLDKNGEIKKLRIGTVTDEQNKNLLTQTVEKQRTYRPSSSFDYTLFLEDGARVFVMPAALSYNEEDYFVTGSGYFSTNWPYTVTAYNTDKYGFTGMLTVRDSSTSQNLAAKDMFLVTEVVNELNGDGDTVKKIYGSSGNYTTISAEGADDSTFDGIQSGDIIQAATDMHGKINRIKKVYSIADGKKSARPSDYIVDDLTFSGTITDIDAENGRLMLKFSDESIQPVRFSAGTPVTVYEQKTASAAKVKTSNIKKGDFVVLRMSHVVIRDIIVIRFDED